jgi:hypothetical protein
MKNHIYHFADDCPNCGEKDALNAWKGARMGSTAWGHDYMCCSEKCGMEFFGSRRYAEMERNRIQSEIRLRKAELKMLGKDKQ